jgi:hypothetical protein
MKNALAFAGAALVAAFILPAPMLPLFFAGAAAVAFGPEIALLAMRLLVSAVGVAFLAGCAIVDAIRTREARIIARIGALAAGAAAVMILIAGPSYAGVPIDCIPIGGDALIPAPAWLPAALQPFWTAVVTVPFAVSVLAHVRAKLPNDPRLSILLAVLDRLVGNYGSARNAAAATRG